MTYKCETCDGVGWVDVFSIGHDVMQKEQCTDCMVKEYEERELMIKINKLLSNVSKQKLIQSLTNKMMILHEQRGYKQEYYGDFRELESMVESKDVRGLLMYFNCV